MGENSKIEWCHHTFNPWIGCTRVGPGCEHCYAETLATARLGVKWGPGEERRRTAPSTWKQPKRWDRQARKAGVRFRVFCASLADVFDNEASRADRADLFQLIRDTPNLDWLLVTKRIGNAAAMIEAAGGMPANVWLGVTIVNQVEADRDIPKLLATPASVRFLSMEPLLEPVDLEVAWHGENALDSECWGDCAWCRDGHPPLHNCAAGRNTVAAWMKGRSGLDWVIVGGESGADARPMHADWARSLRDQCAAAGVPFLFKQWGAWAPGEIAAEHLDARRAAKGLSFWDGKWFECWSEVDGHCDDEPDVYHVGKRAIRRLLDGVEHNGFPTFSPETLA